MASTSFKLVIHRLCLLLLLLLGVNGAAAQSPVPEPEPEMDDAMYPYTVAAAAITVFPRNASDAEYVIETDLENSTLNFGVTTSGALWVFNGGEIQTLEGISSVDHPSSVGLYLESARAESPVLCPQPSSVQNGDDTLVFFGRYSYCAPKAGMLVSFGASGTVLHVFDPISFAPLTPVLSYEPALTAGVGIATDNGTDVPALACEGITNPDEIVGNYCIVRRGGCAYSTKYASCTSAGAVGVVVVNYDDNLPTIGTYTDNQDVPLVMVRQSEGADIVSAFEAYDNVTLTVGASVPSQGSAFGLTWASFDLSTMSAVEPDAMEEEDLPFEYVYSGSVTDEGLFVGLVYDFENETSTNYVLDVSTIGMSGEYEELGSFPGKSLASSNVVQTNVNGTNYIWQRDSPSFYIYDVDALQCVNYITVDTSYCSTTFPAYVATYQSKYLYVSDFIREPETSSCESLGDGIGTYAVRVYDYSTPQTQPELVGTFGIPELQVYTGARFNFGEGEYAHIAAVGMEASGLVFYDFTDPLAPVAVSDVVPGTNVSSLPATLGYRAGVTQVQTLQFPQAVYIGEGTWIVSVTPNAEVGTLFEVTLS